MLKVPPAQLKVPPNLVYVSRIPAHVRLGLMQLRVSLKTKKY